MGWIEKILNALVGNPFSAVAIIAASGFYAIRKTGGSFENSYGVVAAMTILSVIVFLIVVFQNYSDE